jgi:hypothetical protein
MAGVGIGVAHRKEAIVVACIPHLCCGHCLQDALGFAGGSNWVCCTAMWLVPPNDVGSTLEGASENVDNFMVENDYGATLEGELAQNSLGRS